MDSKEVAKCAHELLLAVVSIITSLNNEGILHTDIRIPKICFDEYFNPVLIDFDFCKFIPCLQKGLFSDLKVFATDLMYHLIKSGDFSKEEVHNDKLLNELANGYYIDVLLSGSIIFKSSQMIEEIIKER